ncbi:MAG TPA: FAD-binding protein, partial [Ochrobactrum intermedium]
MINARTAPVLIVGSGLAGLMTALTLSPQPVLLVTAGSLGLSGSSTLAQGGIAAG